jgi:arsenite methyltransferase
MKIDDDVLLCPRCGSALAQLSGEKPLLTCRAHQHAYPIKDGVPVLVPPNLTDGTVETIATFAHKWAYNVTAMREERTRIANVWFYERFGFDGGDELRKFLSTKKRILDAGCGLGNLTVLFARLAPHAEVWGVDLSPAVHTVQRAENIRLVQGDITQLPVEGDFDLIVSDGVLHHTADTKHAMMALTKHLAADGDLLFYIYKVKAPVREFTDDFVRKQMSEMSEGEAMKVCEAIADIGRQLREAKVELHIEKPIPMLGIEAGDVDLQRFIYWHFFKCFHDDGGSEITSALENYDWYAPKYAWRNTWADVSRWIEEAYLDVIRCDDSDSGFAVHTRWRA